MIYTNLNENEIAKITQILDQHQVTYEVSVHGEALEKIKNLSEEEQNEYRKRSRRSGQSLMQIEIAPAEFAKIPQPQKERLHALGIYEEVESPFTEEELARYTSEEYKKETLKTPDPKAGIKQAAAIAAIGVMILLTLMKKGLL